MDQEFQTKLQTQLQEQSAKIDAMYVSVEKTRKYFVTTLWVTAIGFLLPFIGLLFAIPSFLSSYVGNLNLPQ